METNQNAIIALRRPTDDAAPWPPIGTEADPLRRRCRSRSASGLDLRAQAAIGADFQIRSAGTAVAALRALRRLSRQGAEVALVLAHQSLPGSGGIDLLGRARESFPDAEPVLLTTRDDATAAEPVRQALALGLVGRVVETPWRSPEESLYPQLSEALARWWRGHRPSSSASGWSGPLGGRSHQLRDLGTRNAIAFGFVPDSPEGQALWRRPGPGVAAGTILVLVDDRSLRDPTERRDRRSRSGWRPSGSGPAMTSRSSAQARRISGGGGYAASEGLQHGRRRAGGCRRTSRNQFR